MKLGYFTFPAFTLSFALLAAGCNNTDDMYETDVDETTEIEENGMDDTEVDETEVDETALDEPAVDENGIEETDESEVNEAPPDLGEVENFPSPAPDAEQSTETEGEQNTPTGNETDTLNETEGVGGPAVEEEPAKTLPEE